MKRIVNGLTYNTDTSTALAEAEWESDDGQVLGRLYQTRGGAFFVDAEITKEVWNEGEHQHQREVKHVFEPLSQEDAHKWILDGDDVEIFHNPFEDPPEATAEAEPGATIYIRVPASLKHRVDNAAKEEKVSGNVWAMRCVEHCLAGFPEQFSKIWHIAKTLTHTWQEKIGSDAKLDQYKLELAISAMDEISDLVEEFAKERYGTDDLIKISGVESAFFSPEFQNLSRRFAEHPDEN